MHFWVVIPARYASTRLAGKPLLPIAGRPMIQHVYERAVASGAERVVVATDDLRVAEVCQGFGALVRMTSPDHRSGTDRIAEVANLEECADEQILVNVQGDEPMMPPRLISQVAEDLDAHREADIATLVEPIAAPAEVFDPHVVKVVSDHRGYALYFSRAPIPWHREQFAAAAPRRLPPEAVYYRHIGLYAYRAGFVRQFVEWPPCPLENIESLEQLRALWHGRRIHVSEARESAGVGVDTEEDLRRVERLLSQQARD